MSVHLFDLYGVRASSLVADLPVPAITSVDGGDQQLTVHFNYDDSVFPVTDVEYSLDGGGWVSSGMSASPIVISGLTNGQTYSVRVRIVSGTNLSGPSNSETGTPATVPDAPVITSVNSGNQEIFVNFTLGSDGGTPVTDIEYRLGGGSWQPGGTATSPLVIGGQPNQEQMTDIEIRAVNAVGGSQPSNLVEGRATKRPNLERYFALDKDLESTANNLTYATVEASNQVVFHHMNRSTDTEYESWERLPSGPGIVNPKAAWTPGISGTLVVDHDGYLRFYYRLIFPYDGGNKRALAVYKSEDNGSSWDKILTNHRTDIISDPATNMIDFRAPQGFTQNDIANARIIV